MSDFKMTDHQKELFDKLKPLQREVALNSISGMNDIDSYKASSGKAKTEKAMRVCVSQILANLNVKAFLDSMKAAAVSSAVMSRQEMLERQTVLARTSLHDLIEWAEIATEDKEGNPTVQSLWRIKPSVMQDPVKMAAISELTAGKEGIKIKTHSQLAAMKQIAELEGYNAATKFDHTSLGKSMAPKDPRELTDEELAKIIGETK